MKKDTWIISFNNKGFSLIEAIIVLAMIAILASIGIPTYSRMLPDMRLRSAAQDLYGNLQDAKMTAVSANSTSSMTFHTASGAKGTYVKANGTTIDLDEEYDHSVGYGSMDGSSAVDFTDDKAEFNARGMAPTYFGAVYLKNNKDNSYEIRVLTSGAMTLKKWNSSSSAYE